MGAPIAREGGHKAAPTDIALMRRCWSLAARAQVFFSRGSAQELGLYRILPSKWMLGLSPTMPSTAMDKAPDSDDNY